MRGYNETVLLPDLILNPHDFTTRKLEDFPATDTSEVTVVFVTINVLIMEVTVFEIDLLDEATLNEEGNRSVDRRLGNDLFLVSQPKKKLVHIKVVMIRKDLLNDHLPFRCPPKPSLLDVLSEFLDLVHGRVHYY